MATKKKKSFVWKHFSVMADDGKKASCNHCSTIMAFSGATMSNMNRHLKRAHPNLMVEANQMMDIFNIKKADESEAVERSFEITINGLDDLDTLMKEKDDHDPDWTPSNDEGSIKILAEAGPCDAKRERKYRRSVVWDHFEKSPCKTSGQCLYCGKIIKLGTVSNLTRHLRLKHPNTPVMFHKQESRTVPSKVDNDGVDEMEVYRNGGEFIEVIEVNVDDMEHPTNIVETKTNVNRKLYSNPSEMDYSDESADGNATQASQTEFLNDIEDFDINDYIRPKKVAVVAEQVDQQLVRLIVKGCHPVSMVDQPNFREFVSLLNPKYVLPSANKVASELIPECYRDCEKRTSKSLQSAEGIVLHIDQWKSKLNNYLCVTAHFVNAECKFESSFLSCHILPSEEDSAEISEQLLETVKDWEIAEKIVAVMTDNSSHLLEAVKLSNWPHIPHFMKGLSQVVYEGLQTVKAITIKVRNITGELIKDPELLAEVYSTQKILKLPPVKLIKKVNDDWSASFMVLEMLTRFEKLKNPITQVLKNHPAIQPKMSDSEWRGLTNFVEVLGIFKSVKREIVQQTRVSMSKIAFYLRTIKNDMKKYQSSNDATYFATFITTSIDKYFVDLDKTDLIASVVLLDPCLKKYVFQDETEFATACSKLKKEVCGVVLSEPRYPEPNPHSLWNAFDTQIRKLNAIQDPIGKGILEFDNYLQEPLLDRSATALTWWHERRAIYPRMYKLAKKYLCLTSTSSPREAISFKTAHMLSNMKYDEASPTESEVMFLHHNM